jgi:SAM-dependent methyltransferase
MRDQSLWFPINSVVVLTRRGCTHPGSVELIDLALERYSKSKTRNILEIGCGLGWGSNYIHKQNLGEVTAIDLSEKSIEQAMKTCPDVTFVFGDALLLTQLVNKKFDLICIFNTLMWNVCLLENRINLLRTIREIVKKDSEFILFDCVAEKNIENLSIFDYLEISNKKTSAARFDRETSSIIISDEFKNMLNNSGWEFVEFVEATRQCKKCFFEIMEQFKSKRDEIIEKFGRKVYIKEYKRHSGIYHSIEKKLLFGGFFYFKAK